MKGVFWNVRGLGQDPKKRYVREMITDHRLDFIGLMETIKQTFTKHELHSLSCGKNFEWHWNPPRGKSGGILVGINKDSFDVVQVEHGMYFLRVLVYDKCAKFSWNLVSVYGDAQNEGKASFF